MGAKQRESLMDVMVARTTGLVEMHLRRGNRSQAIEAVDYAFKQLEGAPTKPSELNDGDHLVEAELGMRTVLALERVGITTVGQVRRCDPMRLATARDIGKTLAIQILEAVGANVPEKLRGISTHDLETYVGKRSKSFMK